METKLNVLKRNGFCATCSVMGLVCCIPSWILSKLIEDTLLYIHISHSFLNNPYKVDLGDTLHEGVDCIQLAQSRVL